MSKTVSSGAILDLFPAQLIDGGDGIRAIATIAAEQLTRLRRQGDLAGIYTRIDALDEAALDLLAVDFKLDWWEKNTTLEKKRETFKNCWAVHKRLGTKTAIEAAVQGLFEDAELLEWFEYGGRPYHFALRMDHDGEIGTRGKLARILQKIDMYKNVRSVLDAVEIRATITVNDAAGADMRQTTTYAAEIIR